ncbi:MAG: hypothetical protein RL091_2702 [Verrucomicrobiota bacterium]|jgi:hypothetical protein
MDSFMPGFKENIIAITGELRVVVFFVCVAGLMVQVSKARHESEGLMEPVVRAIVVVALVATLPQWFELTERLFLGIADMVNRGYAEHPMQAASLVRDTVKDSDSAFSLMRIHESFYKAFLWAAAKLIVLIGSVLQLPFLLMQHILKLLCYLFLPVALSLFMVPSLASLAVRYVQQTLAVLAWPIGFAVTELVTFNLVVGYQTNLAIADGLTPGQIDASSLASILGGILGVLWLVIGTLATPVLMQMLFCSGAPVSGGGQSALQQLYTMQQVAWMVKSVKTGGAAAAVMVAQKSASAAGGSSGGPGGARGTTQLPPPAAAPAQRGAAPAAADPGGDNQAKAVRSQAQLPTPRTTI